MNPSAGRGFAMRFGLLLQYYSQRKKTERREGKRECVSGSFVRSRDDVSGQGAGLETIKGKKAGDSGLRCDGSEEPTRIRKPSLRLG